MKFVKTLACVTAVAMLTGTASAATLGIATSPAGSLYNRAGTALAKLLNEKLGIKARVQPYSGSSTYIPFLNNDEVQLGLVNVSDAVTSLKGTENFKGRPQPNLRLLSIMFPLPFTFAVPADSPAKKLSDVKGLTFPTHFTAQTTIAKLHRALLANAGLTEKDMKSYPVPNIVKAVEALGDGRVKVAGSTPGMGVMKKAHIKQRKHGGLRFISINTDAKSIAAMQAIIPSALLIIKPAKHTPSVVEPTAFMAFYAFLTTNTKMSDKQAYDIVKTMHDNKPHLVKSTKLLTRFKPDAMTFKMERAYHPGAIKYYKEIGQWPPK